MLSPYLMAASRYSPTSEYYNLSFTVEEITPENYEYGRLYEFTITNTGEGYITYHEPLSFRANGYDHVYMRPINDKESIFMNPLLIMPNEQFKTTHSTTSEYTDFNSGSFSTYAYVNEEFHFDGPVNIIEAEEKNIYLIDYEMPNLGSLRDNQYSFAVTINYDNQKYCLLCELGQDDKICFYTEGGFDLSKAEIVGFKRFRCDVYNGPNYAGLAIGGMLYFLIQIAIGGFILFNLIFIPILIHKIIRKREANNKD